MIDIKHWRSAVNCQDACNLSGVLYSFAGAMHEICQQDLCTNDKNTHPISVLFAYKIAALSGQEPLEHNDVFDRAYHAATDYIEKSDRDRDEKFGEQFIFKGRIL